MRACDRGPLIRKGMSGPLGPFATARGSPCGWAFGQTSARTSCPSHGSTRSAFRADEPACPERRSPTRLSGRRSRRVPVVDRPLCAVAVHAEVDAADGLTRATATRWLVVAVWAIEQTAPSQVMVSGVVHLDSDIRTELRRLAAAALSTAAWVWSLTATQTRSLARAIRHTKGDWHEFARTVLSDRAAPPKARLSRATCRRVSGVTHTTSPENAPRHTKSRRTEVPSGGGRRRGRGDRGDRGPRATATGLLETPRGFAWAPTLIGAADACATVDERSLAERLHDLLTPFAAVVTAQSGPVSRAVGRLSLTLGRRRRRGAPPRRRGAVRADGRARVPGDRAF